MPTWLPPGPARRLAVEVLRHGPLARTDLAARADLSPGSVTRLTAPLLDAGVLVEVPGAPATRAGRPVHPLDVPAGAHRFVGVKLTADRAYAVLTTFRARVLASTERPLASREPAAVADLVTDLLAWGADQGHPVTGAGVSLGGRVDGGLVRHAPFLGWTDVPFRDLLAARTPLPVTVANDVEALTALTHWCGEGCDVATFALLTIGAGIGYGLVANGAPVRADGGLGLVAHHPVGEDAADGVTCDLGHRGCASAVLTSGALAARASAALGRPVDADELLARAGDPRLAPVVDAAGRALGRLVATAANFSLAPLVVLGGEGAALAEVAGDAVRAGLREGRDPLADDVRLVVRAGGFDQWARGAAVEAVRAFVLG